MAKPTDIEGLDVTDPATYPYFREETLRYTDIDPLWHVNNVAIAGLFETARYDYLDNHVGRMKVEGWSFMIVNLTLDYRGQVHYPGRTKCGSRLARIGEKSVSVIQGLFQEERCAATALITFGSVDLETGRSVPVPGSVRRVLQIEWDRLHGNPVVA
jgi:acyl-CoA thioester hydrolase